MFHLGPREVLLGGAGALAATGVGGLMSWRSATGSMSDYERYSAQLRSSPEETATVRELVRFASLAANSHNTQPWLFHAGDDGGLQLLPDFTRRLSVVDPDDHHMFISLGCAAENLSIAARAKGWTCETSPDPRAGLRFLLSKSEARPDPLFDAILTRQSTRALYDGRVPPKRDLDALAQAAARPGVSLTLLMDRPILDKLRDMTIAANSAQISDPAFVSELKSWIRFNPRAAMSTGDGLFAASTGNPTLPGWIGELMFDQLYSARSENEKLASQIDSSPGVAVFVGEADRPANWIDVGRACQRFLLTATQLGLKCAFLNQAVEWSGFGPKLRPSSARPVSAPTSSYDLAMGPRCPFRRAGWSN